MTNIASHHHELNCETPDNRLLVAALEAAVLLDLTPKTRGRLGTHRLAWSELAAGGPSAASDFVAARARHTRQTSHYRLAYELSELILARRRPRDLDATRTPTTAGLAVDMAVLFERAIARLTWDPLTSQGYTGQVTPDSTVPAFIVVPAPLNPAAWIADRYRTDRWHMGETHGSLRIVVLPITEVLAELQHHDFDATRCERAAIAFGDLAST